MKEACYCATRNLYSALIPSIKSLLLHSDVERVWILSEDDRFPEPLPDCVRCINVSGQPWFDSSGPNYQNGWTWMALMRAALHRVFPEMERILSLDVDTIVTEDVSEIWDIPLAGNWLAGVPETHKSGDSPYINAGVMLVNLQQLRADGKGDELIQALNSRHYDYPEQDCINELCQGGILEIPSDYNANAFTAPPRARKILHYAAMPWWKTEPLVLRYRDLPWSR